MVTGASLVLHLTPSTKSRYSTAHSKPRASSREITRECAVELRNSVQTDTHVRAVGSHVLSPNSHVLSPIVHFVLNTGCFHAVLQSKLRRISCAPRWVGARAERTTARSLTTSDGPGRTHTNLEI